MQNLTLHQARGLYGRLKEGEFDFCETQARLVWAIMNGWKKPVKVEDAMDKLSRMGMVEEQ